MILTDKYRELTERLVEALASGTLSEAEDEAIREQMDDIWSQMSPNERKEADERLAAQRSKAPEDLGREEAPSGAQGTMHRRPKPP